MLCELLPPGVVPTLHIECCEILPDQQNMNQFFKYNITHCAYQGLPSEESSLPQSYLHGFISEKPI